MLTSCQFSSSEDFLSKLIDSKSDCINTYELFEKTKQFLKENSNDQQSNNVKKIKAILKRKLRQKMQHKTNNFIGLMCIYIYILGPKDKIQLGTKQFFKNFHKVLLQTYLELRKDPQNKPVLISFSTILFIMVTFIQKAEANLTEISFDFTDKTVENFLNFQIPDDEKLLKSYQIIVLYLMKTKFMNSRQHRRLFFRSIINHTGCRHLPNNFCLVMLSFLKKQMKYYQETEIKNSDKLIQKLKYLITIITDPRKIINILEILASLSKTFFTTEQYTIIFIKISSLKDLVAENENLFIKLVKKVEIHDSQQADKLMTFTYLNNTSVNLTLQVTKKIISTLSFQLFLHFISTEGNSLFGGLMNSLLKKQGGEKVRLSLEIVKRILERLLRQNYYLFKSMESQMEKVMECIDQQMIQNNFQLLCQIRLLMFDNKEQYLL